MKIKKPNLRQIADNVGMSPATVSRALRDVAGTNPSTRAIVKEAAMQLGYPVERNGRYKNPSTDDLAIGVLVHSHRGGINSEFLEGASEAAVSNDVRLLFHQVTTENCRTIFEENFRPRFLETDELDGVILLNHWPNDIVAWLSRKYPVVALVHRYGNPVETVGPDDFEAMRLLLSHLAANGHQRVGYVARAPQLSWSLVRHAALVYAANQLDIELSPEDVLEGEVDSYYAQSFANWDEITGKVLRRADKHGTRAWITLSDYAASTLMQKLDAAGCSTPENIAITGYHGENQINDKYQRKITTVSFPSRKMGAAAVTRLVQRIRSSKSDYLSILFSPTLLIGESTTKDTSCLQKQSTSGLAIV